MSQENDDGPDGMLAYALAIRNPSRNDPNWPLPSFDAKDWAEAFCKIARDKGHDLDEGWMLSWFANALMRGYDEHAMRVQGETIRRLVAALAAIRDMPIPPRENLLAAHLRLIAREALGGMSDEGCDIIDRINAACVGHPHARIPWPHRLLHDARAEITRLRVELAHLTAPSPEQTHPAVRG